MDGSGLFYPGMDDADIEAVELEAKRVLGRIKELPPGDTLIYHTGFLARDAENDGSKQMRRMATGRRDGAMRAYEKGICLLTQRKMMDGWYEYIATRKRS